MRVLTRLYTGLLELIGLVCGLLVGGIALGITVDVLMRNFRWGSLSWLMEVNEYAIYAVTALGAPWALARGAHVRVDLVVKGVPAAIGRWIEVIADLIGLLSSGGLLYYALVVALTSARENARLIKILIIPEWWVYAVIVAGAALLVIEFARRIVRAIKEGPLIEQAPSV